MTGRLVPRALCGVGLYLTYRMENKTDPPTKDLSPFEKFVQAVLRVPKAAVDDAEARRLKRSKKAPRHDS